MNKNRKLFMISLFLDFFLKFAQIILLKKKILLNLKTK